MEIGDYVRFDGEIAKLIDIKKLGKTVVYYFDRILDLNEDRACNDSVIENWEWKYFENVKSSPNIIDLIEVGDYVNGEKVVSIEIDDYKDYNINNNGWNYTNIKSIVTREQFEAIKYEIK